MDREALIVPLKTGASLLETAGPVRAAAPRIVLVGLMGAGKSCIGRMLAAHYGLPFIDADAEIEASAGLTVTEIFERYGEAAFRDGERKVIARLLSGGPHVLATGGGAFMDPGTRAEIKAHGLSLWLRAELDVLVRRTARRTHRPLLRQGDPQEILKRLMDQRYPIYAEADLVVDSDDVPAEVTAAHAIAAIDSRLAALGHPPPQAVDA